MVNSCHTVTECKYRVSFFFDPNEGINPINLVKYESSLPFPEFQKGEKIYISQDNMFPKSEENYRKNMKGFSTDFINESILSTQNFINEHYIHEVKIHKKSKSLSNKWTLDGNNILEYEIEYTLKECFHWSILYWKRVITEKLNKTKPQN